MNKLSKHAISGLLGVFVLGGGVLATGQAVACCAYNHTDVKIKFAWSGATDWHVSPHDEQCEYAKGGTMDVWYVLDNASDFNLCDDLEVDDHGWVTVSHDSYTFTTKSKRKDGSVKRTCVRIYRDD